MIHVVRTICAMFVGVYLSRTGAKMPLEVVEKGVKKGVFFTHALHSETRALNNQQMVAFTRGIPTTTRRETPPRMCTSKE